jgi:hypothetical protein
VSIKNWTQGLRNNTQGIRNRTKTSNGHIVTHWAYFTQISNECQIFTQMGILPHIEHISHKYLMNVKFSHKWSYFYTLSIFHTNIQWKSNFNTNGHIFTHWAYFTQISNECQIFTQMAIFSHRAYFPQISNESQNFTQMTIFSHIEYMSDKYPMKV